MSEMKFTACVIGAGVIGGMVARELTRYGVSTVILEKGSDVALGASKANSGIVHGGYDPEPNTLKAKLNTLGVEKLFCAASELNVPVKRNESFVCAFSEEEKAHLDLLYNRGLENGITALEIIDGNKARYLEKNLSDNVVAALWIKNSGIVCPYELTVAAIGNAMDNGASLICDFEVACIKKSDVFEVCSKDGKTVFADYVINCAGAYSGKIAKLVGDNSIEIIPRAGEYLLLDKNEGERVSRTIFQVPTKEGKGILVSPTVDGNLLTGPTAAVVSSPSDKETTASGMNTVIRLAAKSVPTVNFRNVITSFTGIRSSVKSGDFIIGESEACKGFINVAAIDSPGLTCSVSIAEYVVDIMREIGLELIVSPSFNGKREDPHFFRKMNDDEKNEYIMANPTYGRIVCRCEGISEGEMRYAVKTNPPARDLDGVKRRTRAGMGRCQGGFCSPAVMKLIAEERGIGKEQVTKNGGGSYIVTEKL